MNFKQKLTMVALAALTFASLSQASEPVKYKKWITEIEKMLKKSENLADKEIALIHARLDSLDKSIKEGQRKDRIARARKNLNDIQAKRSTSMGTETAAAPKKGAGSAAAPAQKSQDETLLDAIDSKIREVESYLDAASAEGTEVSDQRAILEEIERVMEDYGAMLQAAGMNIQSIEKRRPPLAKRINAAVARFKKLDESLEVKPAGTVVADLPDEDDDQGAAAPGGPSFAPTSSERPPVAAASSSSRS